MTDRTDRAAQAERAAIARDIEWVADVACELAPLTISEVVAETRKRLRDYAAALRRTNESERERDELRIEVIGLRAFREMVWKETRKVMEAQ